MSQYFVDEQGNLRIVDKYFYTFVVGLSCKSYSNKPEFLLSQEEIKK